MVIKQIGSGLSSWSMIEARSPEININSYYHSILLQHSSAALKLKIIWFNKFKLHLICSKYVYAAID